MWRCMLDSSGWGQGAVVGCHEHDTEISGSVKCGN